MRFASPTHKKWPLLATESSVAQRLEHPNLEYGGSWVRIPSGAQTFSVSSYGWFFTSPFISFININISGIDMQQSNEKDFHGQKLSLNRYFIFVIIIFQRNDGDCETSLSLKCQSLHSFNLLPSIWSIKGIRSSTQRTSIRIDRFVSEPTSN